MEMVADLESAYAELLAFLEQFHIEKDLFAQLLCFQKAMIRKPFEGETEQTFSFDFYSFFDSVIKTNAGKLKAVPAKLHIMPAEHFASMEDYAKRTVWFGRRRGATVYGQGEITNQSQEGK